MVDNPDLERLEALLGQFNIFEAIGAVRQELRHSDFLASLLSPQQSHGLGDILLRSLLQKVLLANRDADVPINLIDLDVWSLEETVALREWYDIDIMLLNEPNKLAVLIENKIDSREHSDQLARYYRTVSQHYRDWKIVPMFLTPDGQPPSDERFLPVSYSMVATLIESIAERRASTLGADVITLLSHYARMLRRHIVNESEIAELCRRIYGRHQRALDLIFEYRPSYQDEVLNIIESLVLEDGGLVLDKRTSNWLAFAPVEWDDMIARNASPVQGNWSLEGRVLLFWIERVPARIRVILEILPGSAEVRERIYAMAQGHQPPFSLGSRKLSPSYCRIWWRILLGKGWQDKYDVEELEERLREQWQQFLLHDLPQLRELVHNGVVDDGS